MLQGWELFFLVCPATCEGGLTFGRPLPAGAVAPSGFLNDLQEFPTAPAEGERTAESRDRGDCEHRVRGRRQPQAVG